jgi:hypothetical protein
VTEFEVWQSWVGRQVVVTLQREPELHEVTGKLLRLDPEGDVDVLEDDGRTAYCWPALDVRLRGATPVRMLAGMGDPHYGSCTECGARRTLVRELVRGGVIYRWLRCPRCGHEDKPTAFEGERA